MKVIVTGATGFIGHYACRKLIQEGHEVIGLSRHGAKSNAYSEIDLNLPNKVGYKAIDITENDNLAEVMEGAQAVIHLVGIIHETKEQTFDKVNVECTRNIIKAAQKAGIKRFLHMSALGISENSTSNYAKSKFQGEELVKQSGLDWTIFRPSLVFGKGDYFFSGVLRGLVSAMPVVPVVGDGKYPFSPISVEDVASIIAQALEKPETISQTYDLVGDKIYTFEELLNLVMAAMEKKKMKIHVPLPLMNIGVLMMNILPKPPINQDQYILLLEGNTANPGPMLKVFAVHNPPLEPAIFEMMEFAEENA